MDRSVWLALLYRASNAAEILLQMKEVTSVLEFANAAAVDRINYELVKVIENGLYYQRQTDRQTETIL